LSFILVVPLEQHYELVFEEWVQERAIEADE
jgi:hypothetical protein